MLTRVRMQAGVKMPRMGQLLLCMFPVQPFVSSGCCLLQCTPLAAATDPAGSLV